MIEEASDEKTGNHFHAPFAHIIINIIIFIFVMIVMIVIMMGTIIVDKLKHD